MKVYGILEGIVEDTQRPAGSHRVTRCVGKLTIVQRVTEDNMGATTVSVEQLTRDEALDFAGVTRCRDCKRVTIDQGDHDYREPLWCGLFHIDVSLDGFCKWGTPRVVGSATNVVDAEVDDG